jgi:two-component system response regulator HydG
MKRSGERRSLSPEAMQKLVEYPWPGNVRELENMIEQAAALATTQVLGPSDIRFDSAPRAGASGAGAVTLAEAVEHAERRAIESSISRNSGDLVQVARELAVSSTTLWRKMKRLGIG